MHENIEDKKSDDKTILLNFFFFSTSFIKFKYDTAKDSISTRTGKPLPAKVINL